MSKQSIKMLNHWSRLSLFLILLLNGAPNGGECDGDESAKSPASSHPAFEGSKPGQVRDDNGLKMKLLWCPPGSFTMGSPKNEPMRGTDEDQVDVTLTRGFWIGKYEVTQKQWRETLQTEPWRNHDGVKEGPDFPASWVSWDDAQLFCEAMTKRDHASGLLPGDCEYQILTEAQWEYAGRAGAKTRFYFGESDEDLAENAWYRSNSSDKAESYAHGVGLKKPNAWGLYDLHGNVQEWCRDWYSAKLAGGQDPLISDQSSARVVVRGGDWRRGPETARLARREPLLRSERESTIGMRVALVYRGSAPGGGSKPEMGVAVVPFENVGTSVGYNRLGKALSEMLADDLAQIDSLRVLERNSVDGLLQERKLAETNLTVPSKTIDRNVQIADYLLTGSFRAEEGKLVISARLMKLGFAKPQAEWKLQGPLDDFLSLERDLSNQVVASLGISSSKRRAPPLVQDGPSPTLAILPLANHSPNAKLDEFRNGLAEVLQANLGSISGIRLVERDKLNSILAEQKLSASGLVDPKTAIRIGKLLKAQRLLVGSFLELGNNVCVQIRLIEAGSAAVLASHKFTGSRDGVAEMIEDLTLKTVADLAVRISSDTQAAIQKQARARTLEGSVHQASALRLSRQGKYGDAADVCQRAILIEPANISFYRERIYLLRSVGRYDEILQTAELAHTRPEFATASTFDRMAILGGELGALSRFGRYADVLQAAKRYAELLPDPHYRDIANSWRHSALYGLGRGAEVQGLMEQAADDETDRDHDWQNYSLRRLYNHYRSVARYPVGFRSNKATYDAEVSRSYCRKAVDIYERVLKSVTGKQDEHVREWAHALIPDFASMDYMNNEGRSTPYFRPEEQIEYLRRGIDAFRRESAVVALGQFHVARALEESKQWEAALEAYRDVVLDQQGMEYSNLPSEWDLYNKQPTTWIDRKIEAYYRVARILHESLDRKDEARNAYREMVREVGLAHFAGADAIVGMHQLGLTPEFPEKCVLLWGGETSAVLSWKRILEPLGYKVHTLRELRVNPPQLTPYSFVVLIRSGNLPFTPRETLALRSYVATGGALLTVISAGWEPAPPGIHNPLLSFFGMECQTEPTIEAPSTRIVAHPITSGISQITARNAIHIKAPADATIIESDERVVLAAAPYRFGRVVVASLGQWYLPDTSILPANWRDLALSGRKENIHMAPVAFDSRLETPLLQNVIQWLTEPQSHGAEYERWRKVCREAQMTAWKAQAHVVPAAMRLIPWQEMSPVLERLIAAAPDPVAAEESLWLAGEAFQQMGFFHYGETGMEPRPHLTYSAYGYNVNVDPLLSEPRFFRMLVQKFPDSPLSPYAEWRLAECARRNTHLRGAPQVITDASQARRLAAEYRKIKTPERSYARTWTNLRLGTIHFTVREFREAVPYFQEIVETMPNGPEKMLALLNLGLCYERSNQKAEGRRAYEAAAALPVYQFRPGSDWLMCWGPLGSELYYPPGFTIEGNGRQLANAGIERLEAK